jgi:hypothetical protein
VIAWIWRTFRGSGGDPQLWPTTTVWYIPKAANETDGGGPPILDDDIVTHFAPPSSTMTIQAWMKLDYDDVISSTPYLAAHFYDSNKHVYMYE